ncbi:MAG: hypothetical protein JXB50_09625 [Spirochaetes bacterium]|nr:hypothetical protein [Spirochaetota bacterium]
MFGIGFGEIIVIFLIVFLIAPKEMPKMIKKTALFFHELGKIKEKIINLNEEVKDIINEEINEIKNRSDKDNLEGNKEKSDGE